jgi:predicted DNA-binding transcriptional regulator AlpA
MGLESRLLNRKTAATYCGVSEATFNAHIVPHLLPIAIGKKLLWDRKAIDLWLDGPSCATTLSHQEWLERVE